MEVKFVENKLAFVGYIKRLESVVLAATPILKKERIKTARRLLDIPERKDTHLVNPSMVGYINVSSL